MNLVDSCGWLEYFADSTRADFYAAALEDPGSLLVPSICLLEVFKRVLQQRGEDAALQAAAAMHQGLVLPLDASLALQAARISCDLKLPLADSVILATARTYGAVIWTQDAHFKGLEGIRYLEKTS
ncbi:MAG: type II toxin-antitoxin system VapC family toxin [Deltaproteobacteria bacterium]|nr:type II toxin-antitoxin system VapC family toxin [Deltaproteobacteria bacterium]